MFFSLCLNGSYIFHPKAEEAKYLENFHLLNTGLGVKMGFTFASSLPISLGILFSGGTTLSIIESSSYEETQYLINPNIATQIDMEYNLGKSLILMGQARYLAVIGGRGFDEWYGEINVGGGVGVRF